MTVLVCVALAGGVMVWTAPVNARGVAAASVCANVGMPVGVLPGGTVGSTVLVGRADAVVLNGLLMRSN